MELEPAPRRNLLSATCLILIMGVAGSGKTTLAREMLRQIWAVYLDNNFIVDAFFPETRTGKRYEKWRPHFYRVLYKIAEENLMVGNSVLLDVPHVKEMRDPKWRRSLKRLAQTSQAELVVIRCHCSDSVLRERLESRGKSRDSWKLTHWQEFSTEQPSLTPIPFPHLDINTDCDLGRNVRTAVRYIRNFSERR